MRTTERPARRELSTPSRRRAVVTELCESGLVMGVPLGVGLGANAVFGWWPGLIALVLASLLVGYLAHRRT